MAKLGVMHSGGGVKADPDGNDPVGDDKPEQHAITPLQDKNKLAEIVAAMFMMYETKTSPRKKTTSEGG
jgi:hypothetical protein